MKQGTVITKVIMLIFLAAVLVYLGYSVVSAVYDPLTTVTAVACTAGERLDAVLWLVREERALISDAPVTSLTVAEGAKTAAGGEVARGYRNQETYARQQDLQEMQARLAQLEYSYEEGGSVRLDASTVADLDNRIDQGITALDRSSLHNDLSAAADQAASLRTLVLRRSASEVDLSLLESNIDALKDEISLLSDQIAVNSSAITAPNAGWFSGSCDGFESLLTPDWLQQASAESFRSMTAQSVTAPAGAVGRLVTSATWYAAALIPESYAAQLSKTYTVQLDTDGTLTDLITLSVESVSAPSDGQCLLTLSCDEAMARTIGLRTLDGGLVLQLYRGIRVPKQAIRLGEDGSPGVYVIEGANAVFKPVTILYDNGETYVVQEDRSSTDYLWVGNEIIVSARNLYNGKVVK